MTAAEHPPVCRFPFSRRIGVQDARSHTPGVAFCYAVGMQKSGQTMVEYILVVVALFAAVSAAWYFVRMVRTQTARTETVLGSEYP